MPPGTEDMEMQVEVLTGTILSLECNGKELTSNFDGHAVLKCSQENCDACTMEFVVLAQPRSIFSLLIGEFSSVSSPTTASSISFMSKVTPWFWNENLAKYCGLSSSAFWAQLSSVFFMLWRKIEGWIMSLVMSPFQNFKTIFFEFETRPRMN